MLQAMLRLRPLGSRVGGLAGWSVVIAFALIGAALLATVWVTRTSVDEATMALSGGQTMMVAHAVRAELPPSQSPPTAKELESLLDAHRADGLRYLAVFSGRTLLAEAGTAATASDGDDAPRIEGPIPRGVRFVGGRLRVLVPSFGPPMMHAPTGRRGQWHIMIEVEPVQANSLREAAGLSLGIGAMAAASLLAVAIVLVRRESRRQADARARERERRLASLGEMSAVLAHEIRNPLASLKGNAQLLAQMLPAGEKPRAKAERVVDEASRLEKLTSDLLRFVRTGELHLASTDPGALVREVVSERAPTGDEGAAPTVHAERAPASWALDADRLREVLGNLVDNALAAGGPVEVAVSQVAGRLRVEVSDRGPGVAAEDRERIFEPFVTGKTQGTGLGLAVARRIAEAHGGALTVHGRPGGGAIFRLELPAGAPGAGAAAEGG